MLVEVAWGVNQKEFVPEQFLRVFDPTAEPDPMAGALDGEFGRAEDLRRVLTFEKLRGSLHDFLCRMDLVCRRQRMIEIERDSMNEVFRPQLPCGSNHYIPSF